MCKLDWSLGMKNSSKTMRIDQMNNHVEFCKQAKFEESVLTTSIVDKSSMAFSIDKQVKRITIVIIICKKTNI